MKDEKKELRRRIREFLKSYDAASIDERIVSNILNSDLYKGASTVFTFVSMKEEHEINVVPLIEYALAEGKRVCVPKCFAGGVMEARRIGSLDDVVSGHRDVPEAGDECPVVEKSGIDLILVPCLCGDIGGYRVGYGGGFYDRYLESYGGKTLLLCREEQMVSEVPVEEHDIPAGYYVTEEGIFATVSV